MLDAVGGDTACEVVDVVPRDEIARVVEKRRLRDDGRTCALLEERVQRGRRSSRLKAGAHVRSTVVGHPVGPRRPHRELHATVDRRQPILELVHTRSDGSHEGGHVAEALAEPNREDCVARLQQRLDDEPVSNRIVVRLAAGLTEDGCNVPELRRPALVGKAVDPAGERVELDHRFSSSVATDVRRTRRPR